MSYKIEPLQCNSPGQLKIISITLKDAISGRLLWESSNEWTHGINDATLTANIPQSVLSCVSVSREITFHAPSEIRRLRLEQQILLHGKTIEEHAFDFGYVIAGSTNTWEQIIIPEQGSMLDAVDLSGNLIIVNHFYDADVLITQCDVKIFYI